MTRPKHPSSTLDLPLLGVGSTSGESLKYSIEVGYRMFDSAEMYGDHHKVLGGALINSRIPRHKYFVVTKLKLEHLTEAQDQEEAKRNCSTSVTNILNDLGIAYIDILLIHWPGKNKNSKSCNIKCKKLTPVEWSRRRSWLWRAMEKEVERGRVKYIGVSNFNIRQLEELNTFASILPTVNQIERHLLWREDELVQYCRKQGIAVMAYRPLGGRSTLKVLKANVQLQKMCEKYSKSLSQVALRWSFQNNIPTIVSSNTAGHILENYQVLDFQLSQTDMDILNNLPQKGRTNDQGQENVR
ncbi:unnamed protein product [Bathycoccus prasinos]